MYARVARWEGSSAEAQDATAAGIRENAESDHRRACRPKD
jgi:hypothetical protein